MSGVDWAWVMYGVVTLILFGFFASFAAEEDDERRYATGNDARRRYARWAVLAPLWPVSLVVFVVSAIIQTIQWALAKEKS